MLPGGFTLAGNRKLIVAVLTISAAFILAASSRLTGEFVTVISITVGGFFAANTLGDHRTRKDADG
ncbi:MAG: hypothetical protein LC667_01320 [Thioalkalivibrio sp.]|nr:hypothetical protein [Thioalkalivibrio sp.]